MPDMIAFCGLSCTSCPAYQVTRHDDFEKRRLTAERWSELFQTEIKPEGIYCDGCQTEGGRLFSYCRTCRIRTCGREKGLENCAHCADYPCDRLSRFFEIAPLARAGLEKIRAGF